MTGLDGNETKLPTYWSTPFTKICLGIKVGHTSTFKAFKWEATSLHSLISPGKTNTTQLGRDWWKSLIGGSSLQWRCNEEGFNVGLGSLSGSYSLARIGIVGNNENHCDTCDSFIGLGTKHKHHPIACGNFAAAKPDNGDRSTPAMCYLFILWMAPVGEGEGEDCCIQLTGPSRPFFTLALCEQASKQRWRLIWLLLWSKPTLPSNTSRSITILYSDWSLSFQRQPKLALRTEAWLHFTQI